MSGESKRANLEESIKANIQLLVTTRLGEFHPSKDFGSSLWNAEFVHFQEPKWLDSLARELKSKIITFEPRLAKENVAVHLELNRNPENMMSLLAIYIEGTIIQNGQELNTKATINKGLTLTIDFII